MGSLAVPFAKASLLILIVFLLCRQHMMFVLKPCCPRPLHCRSQPCSPEICYSRYTTCYLPSSAQFELTSFVSTFLAGAHLHQIFGMTGRCSVHVWTSRRTSIRTSGGPISHSSAVWHVQQSPPMDLRVCDYVV